MPHLIIHHYGYYGPFQPPHQATRFHSTLDYNFPPPYNVANIAPTLAIATVAAPLPFNEAFLPFPPVGFWQQSNALAATENNISELDD